jgi:simple sugar transport system ATP-binding protein
MAKSEPLIRMRGISKKYGGVKALKEVDLQLGSQEVLGLVGDNGAGKSTLIKILTGAIIPDQGEILIDGKKVRITHPSDSQKLGIQAIYQDLSLVGTFDPPANLFLGKEIIKRRFGLFPVLDKKKMLKEGLRTLREELMIDIPNPHNAVNKLSGGQRQAVAIGRAIYLNARAIIMDEPTASLGVEECEKILDLIKRLKTQNCSVIVISHNMEHIFSVCDRVSVLRHGKIVGDRTIADCSATEIVSYITGARG